MRSLTATTIKFIFVAAILVTAQSTIFAQNSSARTIRDFFKLVPSEYFNIACCDGDADAFIEKYVTVEDTPNGYMAGQDTEEDAKYAGFEMALFKRPNGRHIVGLYSYSLRWYDFYFLEYRNGRLVNISGSIPGYSTKHYYQFPRRGTTVGVYLKKYDNPGEPLGVDNAVKKGRKLYDLVWQNGKFVIKK